MDLGTDTESPLSKLTYYRPLFSVALHLLEASGDDGRIRELISLILNGHSCALMAVSINRREHVGSSKANAPLDGLCGDGTQLRPWLRCI